MKIASIYSVCFRLCNSSIFLCFFARVSLRIWCCVKVVMCFVLIFYYFIIVAYVWTLFISFSLFFTRLLSTFSLLLLLLLLSTHSDRALLHTQNAHSFRFACFLLCFGHFSLPRQSAHEITRAHTHPYLLERPNTYTHESSVLTVRISIRSVRISKCQRWHSNSRRFRIFIFFYFPLLSIENSSHV